MAVLFVRVVASTANGPGAAASVKTDRSSRGQPAASAIFADLFHGLVDLAVLLIDLGVTIVLISRRRPTDATRRGSLGIRGRRSRGSCGSGRIGPGRCGIGVVTSIDRSLIAPGLGTGSDIGDT